jgi:hypothetical protein
MGIMFFFSTAIAGAAAEKSLEAPFSWNCSGVLLLLPLQKLLRLALCSLKNRRMN